MEPNHLRNSFLATYSQFEISPISKQAAAAKRRKNFERRIKSHFQKKNLEFECPNKICLSLTFVLNKKGRNRDLDNLAKAIQDALARALGFNDKDVDHLDIVKLSFEDTEEYIYVSIRPSLFIQS